MRKKKEADAQPAQAARAQLVAGTLRFASSPHALKHCELCALLPLHGTALELADELALIVADTVPVIDYKISKSRRKSGVNVRCVAAACGWCSASRVRVTSQAGTAAACPSFAARRAARCRLRLRRGGRRRSHCGAA